LLFVRLSTCLNPFFWYGPSGREEDLNQFYSLSAITERTLRDTTGTGL